LSDADQFWDYGLVRRLLSREFEELQGFFVGNFHEDWSDDFPDDDAVIRDFLERAEPEQVNGLRVEMDALLALGLSDDEMLQCLDVFGCSYDEGWFAHGVTEWVRSVRTRLGSEA
jgi:hypothetical protein